MTKFYHVFIAILITRAVLYLQIRSSWFTFENSIVENLPGWFFLHVFWVTFGLSLAALGYFWSPQISRYSW